MDPYEEGGKSAVPCERACLRLYCFFHCEKRVTGPGLVPHQPHTNGMPQQDQFYDLIGGYNNQWSR